MNNILYENGDFWVAHDEQHKGWFTVYENVGAVARPVMHVGPERDGKYGLKRAIEECNKKVKA